MPNDDMKNDELIKGMFSFIDKSVSPFHSVACAEELLLSEGFIKLSEMDEWNIETRGKYYVTRNGSSIIAFAMPGSDFTHYSMTACHSDSPSFKGKNVYKENDGYIQALVEKYGGMILSTWLDRPLSVAGRAVLRDNSSDGAGIVSKNVNIDSDYMVIPNLAIHFNREINDGYKYNPEKDMRPVYSSSESITDTLSRQLDISKEDILNLELYLYCRQKACLVGARKEFYMSPRIDDLSAAYLSLRAFLDADSDMSTAVNVWCMFDNEEVGSGTMQGAMSSFAADVLDRIEHSVDGDLFSIRESSIRRRQRSLLLSVDNAHAIHPNIPEKSDMNNPVRLNGGIVVKYNANQKYTTNGVTGAVFEMICNKADVPVQRFYNRADVPGGSTLGNLLSRQVSIPMADIGLPQLAMHSAVETAGCRDLAYMYDGLKCFYQSRVWQVEDGRWTIS